MEADRPDALTEALAVLGTFPPAQRARLLGALLDRRNTRVLARHRRAAVVELVDKVGRVRAAAALDCSPNTLGNILTEHRQELAAPVVSEGSLL